MHCLARVEMPERSPRVSFNRLQGSGIITKENQSTGGCQRSSPGIAVAHLGIAPHGLSFRQRKRYQRFLSMFIRRKCRARTVVGLAWGKPPRFTEEQIATVQRHYKEKPGVG